MVEFQKVYLKFKRDWHNFEVFILLNFKVDQKSLKKLILSIELIRITIIEKKIYIELFNFYCNSSKY